MDGFKKNKAWLSTCRYVRFCDKVSNGVFLKDALSRRTVFANFGRDGARLAALKSTVVMHVINTLRCPV